MDRPTGTGPHQVQVKQLGAEGPELAVFEFQGELRDLMVSSLHEGYLATGSYVADARAVSSQGAKSMAFAGAAAGATALSGAFSESLFIATADPSTLMKIGDGVGSAVMGVNGISGQAAFVPIASSLPIVAPILAMQTLNAAVMMQQFQEVDRKLDAIKNTLDKAIARTEATHAGELLAASAVVDDIYRQYELEGQFSQDMLMRLSLAERDVRSLAVRFGHLVEASGEMDVPDPTEVQQANYDAHSAMLSSFLDLRIAYLRVCVDMQETPKSVASSVELLKAKIDDSTAFWSQLQDRSLSMKQKIEELEASLQDMNFAERYFPKLIGGKGGSKEADLQQLRTAYTKTMESERDIMKGFHSLIESAEETRNELDGATTSSGSAPTIVYWEDEAGTHSFVTEQLRLQ